MSETDSTWSEKYGDIDPYAEDDKPKPDETPQSEYEEDEHGEYKPSAGAQSREQVRKAGRCGAVLKYWRSRYGERRYCTRLPENLFIKDGSPYCRTHKGRGGLKGRENDGRKPEDGGE